MDNTVLSDTFAGYPTLFALLGVRYIAHFVKHPQICQQFFVKIGLDIRAIIMYSPLSADYRLRGRRQKSPPKTAGGRAARSTVMERLGRNRKIWVDGAPGNCYTEATKGVACTGRACVYLAVSTIFQNPAS